MVEPTGVISTTAPMSELTLRRVNLAAFVFMSPVRTNKKPPPRHESPQSPHKMQPVATGCFREWCSATTTRSCVAIASPVHQAACLDGCDSGAHPERACAVLPPSGIANQL